MRPTMPVLAIALMTSALPGSAIANTFCEDLWVTRNMLFHRAGYCFGSPLGQTLFGNAGCRTADAGAVSVDREAVDYVRGLEQAIGCRVNTGGAPTPTMWARKTVLDRLIDIPIPDEFGYACWGYNGPPVTLHAGASEGAPVIGMAQTRQSIGMEHRYRNGWNYVTVSNGPGTATVAEGWSRVATSGLCDQEAG